MIMDQCLFCLADSTLNGVELLGKIEAWTLIFYHFYDMAKVPFGPLEPPDYRRMRLVDVAMVVSHKINAILPPRIQQADLAEVSAHVRPPSTVELLAEVVGFCPRFSLSH